VFDEKLLTLSIRRYFAWVFG